MNSEFERMLDDLLHPDPEDISTGLWVPDADVVETPEHVVVLIEMGGVDRDGLDIIVAGNRLIVTGRRDCPIASPVLAHHQKSVAFGPFRSEFALPWPVKPEDGEARLLNGLLVIQIAKELEVPG